MADEPQVYLNGRYVPRSEAKLDVEDRGAMFADGVYEVVRYYNGHAFAMGEHVARLRRSLEQIDLPVPADVARLEEIADELVRINAMPDARVYWQVTRGAGPRQHVPATAMTPTVLVMTTRLEPVDFTAPAAMIRLTVAEDQRWARCDIKSLALLPNVLAAMRAHEAGFDEVALQRGGVVTEGSHTTLFMVKDEQLFTHPADKRILPGVTRSLVIDVARKAGITVHERAFTVEQMCNADELIVTGTTTHLAAVVQVDNVVVGSVPPAVGDVTMRLYRAYLDLLAPFYAK
jgi:D-alanine transaminase